MPRTPRSQKTPEGYEIPIPTRGEFATNLAKVAKNAVTPKKVAKGRSGALENDVSGNA
jgi:hypothetical protein